MTAPVSDEWVATTMTAEWANYVNRMSVIGEPTHDRMRRAWEAGFHIAIAALAPLIAAAEQRGREQAAAWHDAEARGWRMSSYSDPHEFAKNMDKAEWHETSAESVRALVSP